MDSSKLVLVSILIATSFSCAPKSPPVEPPRPEASIKIPTVTKIEFWHYNESFKSLTMPSDQATIQAVVETLQTSKRPKLVGLSGGRPDSIVVYTTDPMIIGGKMKIPTDFARMPELLGMQTYSIIEPIVRGAIPKIP